MSVLETLFDEELKPKNGQDFFPFFRDFAQTADKTLLKTSLKTLWEKWQREQDSPGWKQNRGYFLERLILALLQIEGLEPSPSYYQYPESTVPRGRGRPAGGEQVDGFFVFGERFFLMETKWEQTPMKASDIYAFQGRMGSKLVGTLGIIISVSGFQYGVENTITKGKPIDILLVTGEDISCIFESKRSFREMMKIKLRRAALVGRILYTYQEFIDENRTKGETHDTQ